MPKLCPNIRFPHQQDFFPIRSVTKSSTSRFSHENLVEKFKIFGQDFVPIRTALLAREICRKGLLFNMVLPAKEMGSLGPWVVFEIFRFIFYHTSVVLPGQLSFVRRTWAAWPPRFCDTFDTFLYHISVVLGRKPLFPKCC